FAFDQRCRLDQAIGGARVELKALFKQRVQLLCFGVSRLAVERDQVNEQAGGREPIIVVSERAPLVVVSGGQLGNEVTKAFQHLRDQTSNRSRGFRGVTSYMSANQSPGKRRWMTVR